MEKSQECIQVWSNVPEVHHAYEVSNFGQVRNKQTQRIYTQRLTKGYYYVRLHLKEGGETKFDKNLSVHRMVAKAFCAGHSKDLQVNHVNGDKLDNRSVNLEWVTQSQNMRHAIDTGLMDHSRYMYHIAIPRSKVEKVFLLREKGLLHREIADRLGIGKSTVTHILLETRRKII